MSIRLLTHHKYGAPWTRLCRRVTNSASLKRPTATEESDSTNKVDSAESPEVVESSPVYSKDEVSTEKTETKGTRKGRAGARSEFVQEREPVVIHDMADPIQTSKWYRIIPESVDFAQVGYSHIPRVPKLGHGLERVLFSPGVHCLQDPHSGVYNFDPYIRDITQPADFDYDKLTPYITSSKDKTLMGYARRHKKQFVGSTSSMTHVLSHLYFVISAGKNPDISSMSMAFADMPSRFTRGMRYPASIALRYQDGVYGIDADKSFDVQDSILSILGKSLEKLLSSTPREFDMYKKANSWKVKDIPEENYHYVEFDNFVLRSQLDCRDDRLPRKTFDLKTRGSLAVRMDLQNYELSKGYQIVSMKGRLQSFEREYYDMIRSAFLKYNFQTRIGNMDGIFVAYHNTARMFGFQYIPRKEMDRVLFGNEYTGDKAFKAVLILLSKLLRTITDLYPEKDIRVTFDSASSERQQMDIWVEVLNDEAEAAAMLQYPENGFVRAKPAPKKPTPPPAASESTATDPFDSAADPLASSGVLGENVAEESLADDPIDDYIDPADEIYVNTEQPIFKYTMETFSTLNDQDTDEPITVKKKEDQWYINWKLTKSRLSQDDIVSQYRRLRLRQATYFERASPDTPDEELSPMIKILRRISRQNLWRNKPPTGRVIVNRSRLPIHVASKPAAGPTGSDTVQPTSAQSDPKAAPVDGDHSGKRRNRSKPGMPKTKRPRDPTKKGVQGHKTAGHAQRRESDVLKSAHSKSKPEQKD
ncbi:hypothetical protein IWW39_004757 [Coemansia spiralis]|uniref:Pet127-domain-containing protein n=1 Tax=Coemansia spiralis TaxID=417178 RepID=A0A9W8GGQ5_9FUNG|nr:hypothetical protein IWW39_004757 [Coemansia spiralis]